MCDISKKTKLKQVTVYKAVDKNFVYPEWEGEGKYEYVSCFTYFPLRVGRVEKDSAYSEGRGARLYNQNMIGRVSGFVNKKYAKSLVSGSLGTADAVLKIVLGGDIMQGTGKNISEDIPSRCKVYAGTEILSMEEIP